MYLLQFRLLLLYDDIARRWQVCESLVLEGEVDEATPEGESEGVEHAGTADPFTGEVKLGLLRSEVGGTHVSDIGVDVEDMGLG